VERTKGPGAVQSVPTDHGSTPRRSAGKRDGFYPHGAGRINHPEPLFSVQGVALKIRQGCWLEKNVPVGGINAGMAILVENREKVLGKRRTACQDY